MHRIKQLSIFVENKTGELTDITSLLSKNKISIKSINLAESSDFGLLRIIVNDEKSAKKVIDDAGFSLKVSDILAIRIDDHVGSFNEAVDLLSKNGINIEYVYTISNAQLGAFAFKVSAVDFNKAIDILQNSNITILEEI